jgi:VanZ family protein
MSSLSFQSKLNSRTANSPPLRNGRSTWFATLFYTALIVYGSLYPLTGWTVPHEPLFSFLTAAIPTHISRADVLTNVLAYIPLGILLVWTFHLAGKFSSITAVTLVGGLLSLSMESVQMFLPSRTASNIDLLTNIIGTSLGACMGFALRPHSALMLRIKGLRDEWFAAGRGVDIGLCAVFLWALSQLSPFVPSMDISSIRDGLKPVWYSLNALGAFSFFNMLPYTLNVAGLTLLIGTVARPRRPAMLMFLYFAAAVLCIKPFIVSRQLSLEAVCGLVVAAILLMLAPKKPALRAVLSMVCIFAGFTVAELSSGVGGLHSFNWVPFAGQIDNTVSGFGSILEGTWPFAALACLTVLGFGRKLLPMIWVGGVVLAVAFALEWEQQQIPGRYGDVTTVILAGMGWILSCLYVMVDQGAADEVSRAIPLQHGYRSSRIRSLSDSHTNL